MYYLEGISVNTWWTSPLSTFTPYILEILSMKFTSTESRLPFDTTWQASEQAKAARAKSTSVSYSSTGPLPSLLRWAAGAKQMQMGQRGSGSGHRAYLEVDLGATAKSSVILFQVSAAGKALFLGKATASSAACAVEVASNRRRERLPRGVWSRRQRRRSGCRCSRGSRRDCGGTKIRDREIWNASTLPQGRRFFFLKKNERGTEEVASNRTVGEVAWSHGMGVAVSRRSHGRGGGHPKNYGIIWWSYFCSS
jgi:hypothetical protein